MIRFAAAFFAAMVFAGAAVAETPFERGRYLVSAVLNCGNCHTPRDADVKAIAERALSGGLTFVTPAFTAYGSWSQGNRAPSPIELGCSDPANACVLPNALQSDPPLNQVVSQTLEAGVRGSLADGLRWNASVFRTINRDDLLFISNGLSAGYFSNVGRTDLIVGRFRGFHSL